MEFRKLFLFFDHSSLPFKRRVLSGFGLGLLASLLLFSLLSSLNAPSALTSSASSSSFFSWVFSIPDAISGSDSANFLLGQDANSSDTYSLSSAVESSDLGMTHFMNATVDTTQNSNSSWLLNVEPILEKAQDGSSSSFSLSARESNSVSAHIESSAGESKNSSSLVTDNVHLENSSKDDGMAKAFEDKDGVQRQDLGVQGSGKNLSNASTTEGKVETATRNNTDSGSMKKTIVEFGDKCNIFNGRWVRDERDPFYPAGSCPYIDIDFDCHKNGRLDDGFLRWRWQPNDCDIPRGGQWNSGGQCHKETEPIFSETFLAKYPSKMRAFERVMEQMETPVIYLNISRLTDYRKDGHPSIYRKAYNTVEEHMAAETSQDCSHWCLPGIPDAWNELLYASLLINGKGSWLQ